MADFKTPNLCGANETLNDALSKIKNLKDEILAQSTALPSVKKAAFESKLTELKSSLDGLAPDLPEAKPVNLQSELTSLINDVDRTTAQGIASFNAKVAELKKDFGGAIGDKGLDLDKLIDEGTTKLGKDIGAVTGALSSAVTDVTGAITDTYSSVTNSLTGGVSNISSGLGLSGVPGNISDAVPSVAAAPTGGNLCDLVPNLELPASAAGTGVTTEEIDDRISNSETLTLSQTPKEILEVQGKKTTQSFFTNIQYTQNGKIIVPKQGGIYDTIKAKYTVSLIKEKPIAAKQADAPAETEEVSTITKNASVETKKTELKSKVEAVKSGNSFTPTTKSTPIVTPTGKTIKATTSKDAVTTNENGEKVRSTKSADGIAGKYISVKEMFYSPANWDRFGYKRKGIPYSEYFKKGLPDLRSLEEHPSWANMILTLKHEPVDIVTFFWKQWDVKFKNPEDKSGGLVARISSTKPKDPDNIAAVNSPSILIGKTLDFSAPTGSTTYKLPIGIPLFIGVRYNILDTTDSNYV